MSIWESQLLNAANEFLADAIPCWGALGVHRPPEFWIDSVHDAVGGAE